MIGMLSFKVYSQIMEQCIKMTQDMVTLKLVMLYSIVSCSHVRLRTYNELFRNMHSHVRIECEFLIMDVPT